MMAVVATVAAAVAVATEVPDAGSDEGWRMVVGGGGGRW